MKNKYFTFTLSIIIGLFFIVSGAGKIVNTAGFENLLEKYGLGYIAYLAPVICVAEIVLGFTMILLVNQKKYSMFCFIALILFTVLFAYAYFFKNQNDCGCFGEIDFLKSSPLVSFIRNILLMLFCIIIYKNAPPVNEKASTWKINMILVFASISLILSGFTMSEPIISSVPFQNQNIENTALTKYVKTSKDSTYLIFVFSYKCPHCWDATENVKSYKEQKVVDRIIGIALKDSLAEFNYRKTFNIDFKIINVTMDSLKPLVKTTPTAFIIKNNKVEYVMQRTIYNALTFSNHNPLMKTQ